LLEGAILVEEGQHFGKRLEFKTDVVSAKCEVRENPYGPFMGVLI
jgi:hypothetical protein